MDVLLVFLPATFVQHMDVSPCLYSSPLWLIRSMLCGPAVVNVHGTQRASGLGFPLFDTLITDRGAVIGKLEGVGGRVPRALLPGTWARDPGYHQGAWCDMHQRTNRDRALADWLARLGLSRTKFRNLGLSFFSWCTERMRHHLRTSYFEQCPGSYFSVGKNNFWHLDTFCLFVSFSAEILIRAACRMWGSSETVIFSLDFFTGGAFWTVVWIIPLSWGRSTADLPVRWWLACLRCIFERVSSHFILFYIIVVWIPRYLPYIPM